MISFGAGDLSRINFDGKVISRAHYGVKLIWSTESGVAPVVPEFIQSVTSIVAGIDIPSGAQIGDLAIFIDAVSSGATNPPAEVIPNGWTKIASENNTTAVGHILNASYKILGAADIGSTIFGSVSTAGTYGKAVYIYRTSSTISGVLVSSFFEGSNDPPPVSLATPSDLSIDFGVKTVYGGTLAGFSPDPFTDKNETNGANIDLGVGAVVSEAAHTLNFDTADNGNFQFQFGFIINFESSGAMYITGDLPTNMQVNSPIMGFSYVAHGGAGSPVFSVGAGAFPAGVTMLSSGAVSGTPTTQGSGSVTVHCVDGADVADLVDSWSVAPATANITVSGDFPSLNVGVAITPFSFTATGGQSPYSFAVSAGTMPAGLTLATNGQVTGTPTAAGAYSVTIRATDANSATGTKANSGTVEVAAQSIGYIANNVFAQAGDRNWFATVPAGCVRAGICIAGMGGDGDITAQGAGGGGGALVFANLNVVAGDILGINIPSSSKTLNFKKNGVTGLSVTSGANATSTVGGIGGTASGSMLSSFNVSRGGDGGDCPTTGRSAGGGGAGGYTMPTDTKTGGFGGNGQVGGQAGFTGFDGGSAGGNGVGTGALNQSGGSTGVFGIGLTGATGGENGSVPTVNLGNYATYIGGGGGRGRNAPYTGAGAAFMIRFFCDDYPTQVAPDTIGTWST